MSRRDDKARAVRYQFSIITVACTGTYALFQRAGSQSSQCTGRIGNRNSSFTRSGNSRHSNRRGHHGIECSGVSDHSRHSNLRGCYSRHVSIARRIQISEDCNGLTHDCAARSGKRFPRRRIGLQRFDCSVAAPHSSHCHRRFNNSRHSNLRGYNGIERSRVADDSRHSNLRGCHGRHSNLRGCNRRHSNRRGHHGIERCRVCDDSRHSNLMRRKHSSFGVLVCIINIPKSERGITT